MNLCCNNCSEVLDGLNFGLVIKDNKSFVYCNDCFKGREVKKEEGDKK